MLVVITTIDNFASAAIKLNDANTNASLISKITIKYLNFIRHINPPLALVAPGTGMCLQFVLKHWR
ncbi:hypothetical protein BF17_14310 [Yersinia similis]|uniref:Uncharacterized protein n=1 Tax=Yersinia similis TaxID=367190 RepID=A0ABM5Q3K2_9GAMM|nr:hypothetical protein BF17_14310 [Yersinia similis]